MSFFKRFTKGKAPEAPQGEERAEVREAASPQEDAPAGTKPAAPEGATRHTRVEPAEGPAAPATKAAPAPERSAAPEPTGAAPAGPGRLMEEEGLTRGGGAQPGQQTPTGPTVPPGGQGPTQPTGGQRFTEAQTGAFAQAGETQPGQQPPGGQGPTQPTGGQRLEGTGTFAQGETQPGQQPPGGQGPTQPTGGQQFTPERSFAQGETQPGQQPPGGQGPTQPTGGQQFTQAQTGAFAQGAETQPGQQTPTGGQGPTQPTGGQTFVASGAGTMAGGAGGVAGGIGSVASGGGPVTEGISDMGTAALEPLGVGIGEDMPGLSQSELENLIAASAGLGSGERESQGDSESGTERQGASGRTSQPSAGPEEGGTWHQTTDEEAKAANERAAADAAAGDWDSGDDGPDKDDSGDDDESGDGGSIWSGPGETGGTAGGLGATLADLQITDGTSAVIEVQTGVSDALDLTDLSADLDVGDSAVFEPNDEI